MHSITLTRKTGLSKSARAPVLYGAMKSRASPARHLKSPSLPESLIFEK